MVPNTFFKRKELKWLFWNCICGHIKVFRTEYRFWLTVRRRYIHYSCKPSFKPGVMMSVFLFIGSRKTQSTLTFHWTLLSLCLMFPPQPTFLISRWRAVLHVPSVTGPKLCTSPAAIPTALFTPWPRRAATPTCVMPHPDCPGPQD